MGYRWKKCWNMKWASKKRLALSVNGAFDKNADSMPSPDLPCRILPVSWVEAASILQHSCGHFLAIFAHRVQQLAWGMKIARRLCWRLPRPNRRCQLTDSFPCGYFGYDQHLCVSHVSSQRAFKCPITRTTAEVSQFQFVSQFVSLSRLCKGCKGTDGSYGRRRNYCTLKTREPLQCLLKETRN